MTALRMRARDFLDEDQLIAVRQRVTWKGVALIAHAWALILGAIALVAWWPNPLTFLLAVGVIGSRQLGLAILMHDGAHGCLSADEIGVRLVGSEMCIRDRGTPAMARDLARIGTRALGVQTLDGALDQRREICLLYTSDAADE